MVNGIREVEIALGSKIKRVSLKEYENSLVVRKSIVARTKIKKGDKFNKNNLCIKRPGTGISPLEYWNIIGRVSTESYLTDDFNLNKFIIF